VQRRANSRTTTKRTSSARASGALPPFQSLANAVGSVHERESDFQRWVVDLAGWRGWRLYHTFDSRRSESGFPDLVLVRDRVLFRELKNDTRSLTREQRAWLDALVAAGADAKVWRPRDRAVIERELS
jgi:hypothetical protein